jgi:hypothetical protein
MSEALTKEVLLEVWRRDMDPGYTQPLETEKDGRGLDVIAGLAAMFERSSRAVLVSTQALYLKPHSQQLAPPASGSVVATGAVEALRRTVVGGPLRFEDGDRISAHFLGVNGEDVDAPMFEVVGDVLIPSGSEGPTVIPVRCERPGFQGNVPPGTPGRFPPRRGGNFVVVSYTAGTLTIDPDEGDGFVPTMSGMLWRFTSGANLGRYARRLVIVDADTATIEDTAGLVTQGAGVGQVVDFQDVGNFVLTFQGTNGGRSGELDLLGSDRTQTGRAFGESDEDFRARIGSLPEAITPNAIIRAIAAVLEPVNVPFQFVEVWEAGVGFFFSGDSPDIVDSAWSDPFAYRNAMFFVGGAMDVSIGFVVVVNGQSLPPEPDLTRILAALSTAIIAAKGSGVPWAIVFEPPIP